jgi:hypothetical protein
MSSLLTRKQTERIQAMTNQHTPLRTPADDPQPDPEFVDDLDYRPYKHGFFPNAMLDSTHRARGPFPLFGPALPAPFQTPQEWIASFLSPHDIENPVYKRALYRPHKDNLEGLAPIFRALSVPSFPVDVFLSSPKPSLSRLPRSTDGTKSSKSIPNQSFKRGSSTEFSHCEEFTESSFH